MSQKSDWILEEPDNEAESKQANEIQDSKITTDGFDYDLSISGHLYSKSLDEVIKYGYVGSNVTRTGVGTFPVGLISWWRDIANNHGFSLSKVQRITIMHGLSICAHDPRIKEVRKLYIAKAKEAQETRDKIAIKVLEEKGETLHFLNDTKLSTSIGLTEDIEGGLSSISAALGIPNTKLALYVAVMSLMTLKPCGWTDILKEDLEIFWRHVEKRIKILR